MVPTEAAQQGRSASPDCACEARTEPLGVDRARPELSWIVESDERAQEQKAYRILVATSADKLARNEGDLWDSGRVNGAATFGIAYAGRPLVSHQQCFWKVMAWDAAEQPGPWSAPARWTAGLFDSKDWQGDWIGYDEPAAPTRTPPRPSWTEPNGLATPPTTPSKLPAEGRVYIGHWRLPTGTKIARAELIVTGDDSVRGANQRRSSGAGQPRP